MGLRRLSVKQKLWLLILGLAILMVLIFGGTSLYKNGQILEETPVANEELLILGTAETVEGLEENAVYTDKGIYYFEKEIDWSKYLCQSVQAVTEENKILHIKKAIYYEYIPINFTKTGCILQNSMLLCSRY